MAPIFIYVHTNVSSTPTLALTDPILKSNRRLGTENGGCVLVAGSYKLLIRYLSPLKMCNQGRQLGLKRVGAEREFSRLSRPQVVEFIACSRLQNQKKNVGASAPAEPTSLAPLNVTYIPVTFVLKVCKQ